MHATLNGIDYHYVVELDTPNVTFTLPRAGPWRLEVDYDHRLFAIVAYTGV